MRKNLLVFATILLMLSLYPPLSQGADNTEVLPKIVATNPKNGATDIDPSLSEITVTFNKPMLDKSWSWSYRNKDSFPQTAGQPFYEENGTKCVLPVKLKPGKRYELWINTAKSKKFRDRSGNAVKPYRLRFATRQG